MTLIRRAVILMALTGLAVAGGCKKKGGASGPKGKAAKKPEVVLSGQSRQRLRDLELSCKVEVDPDENVVWVEISVHNHGEQPQYLGAPNDVIWMHDRGGQAAYAVGAPQRWPDKPPQQPYYATLAPQETRTWTLEGVKSPSALPDPPIHSYVCAAALGPDGRQFLQAGGRAVNGALLKEAEGLPPLPPEILDK